MGITLKLWIGNYDGRREGLIYAKSKKAAAKIAGCSVKHFNDYWSESTRVVQTSNGAMEFEPETLYTRPIGSYNGVFFKGRFPL